MSLNLGAFELLHRIARGGMGEVWKGLHRATSTPVAIKLMTGANALNEDFGIQFRREVQAMARLEHPNIADIFEFGILPDGVESLSPELRAQSPYLVMELGQHGDLHDIKKELEWSQIRSILESSLHALAHAHARGVIHRDIKPGNILMANGEFTEILLTDFGIAHASDQQTRTDAVKITSRSSENASGTPSHMAPEQFMGRWRDYGPWTDLYSIGILAYQMVCHRLPYVAQSFVMYGMAHMNQPFPDIEPAVEIPGGLEGWITKLVAKQPAIRFQHASDALRALERLQRPSRSGSHASGAFDDEAPTILESEPLRLENQQFSIRDFSRRTTASHEIAADWRDVIEMEQLEMVHGAGLDLFGLKVPPMTAREEERDRMWSLMREAFQSRTSRALVVRGPTGSGKSRLVKWLSESAHEKGYATVLTSGHQADPGPRHGLSWMLTSFYRCAGLDAASIFERVDRILESDDDATEFEVRALTEIMRTHLRDPDSTSTSAAYLRFTSVEQRHGQIARTLELESRRRPVMVILDDAHWSPQTLDFVRRSLDFEPAFPLLMVVTIDDSKVADLPETPRSLQALLDHSCSVELELDELTPNENRRLLRSFGLSAEVSHKVVRHAQNQTLFALQLVQDWVASGILYVDSKGELSLDDDLLEDTSREIPADLVSVWRSKLDRAPRELSVVREFQGAKISIPIEEAEAARAMTLAACLGVEVDEDEWLEACEYEGLSRLPELLDRLASEGIGQRHQHGFTFLALGLRDEIGFRAIASSEWQRAHATCAEMLSARYDDSHPGIGLRIARHQMSAGLPERALEPLQLAYDEAFRSGNLDRIGEVLDMTESGLREADISQDDVRWGQLYLQRAKRLIWSGDETAREQGEKFMLRVEKIVNISRDPLLTSKFLVTRAWMANVDARFDEAYDLATQALSAAPNHAEEAIVERIIGSLLQNANRVEEAREHFERSARLTSDPIDTFSAHLGLAQCLQDQPDEHDRAVNHLEMAVQVARESGLALGQALALETLGVIETSRRNFSTGEEHLRSALALHQVLGSQTVQALKVRELLGRSLLPQGRYEEAQAVVRPLRIRLEHGSPGFYVHLADFDLACLAGLGRWDEFEDFIDEATSFNFPPQGIHARALGWAKLMAASAGRDDLAAKLDEGFADLRERYPLLEKFAGLFDQPV